MKKVFPILLSLLLLLPVISACRNEAPTQEATQETTQETTREATQESTAEKPLNEMSETERLDYIYGKTGAYPSFQAEVSPSEGTPGGEVTLSYRMENGKNIACFSMVVSFDRENLSLADYEIGTIDNFIFQESENKGSFVLYGYTATTADFDENDVILNLTFRIDENCALSEVPVSLKVSSFLVGMDESGDATAKIPDEIYKTEIVVRES